MIWNTLIGREGRVRFERTNISCPTKIKPFLAKQRFCKVRLIRKRWWKKTYSQMGEDVVLQHIFEDQPVGFYVDVGCFHPKKYSNTRLLYECGWRGVNIDISQRKISLFKFARPDDLNIFSAAADKPGELQSYVFDNGSALDTTDRETADVWVEQFGKSYVTVQVLCEMLSEILSTNGVSRVDYLNIDVEGAEMAVLNGMDFVKYKPKCISIEIHGNLDTILSSEPYKMLKSLGYELHAWLKPTLIFVLP